MTGSEQTSERVQSNRLQTAATVVLASCAIVITLLLVKRELIGSAPKDASPFSVVRGAEKYGRAGTVIGQQDAPVTIVEFSDFQCPFCRAIQPALDSLHETHRGKFKLVYRHLPILALHPHAQMSAYAAECGGVQGKFKEIHDVLYERQAEIGAAPWMTFAVDAGIQDTAAFGECLNSDRFAEVVARDVAAARELGVRATPSLLIGSTLVRGRVSYAELERLVREASP